TISPVAREVDVGKTTSKTVVPIKGAPTFSPARERPGRTSKVSISNAFLHKKNTRKQGASQERSETGGKKERPAWSVDTRAILGYKTAASSRLRSRSRSPHSSRSPEPALKIGVSEEQYRAWCGGGSENEETSGDDFSTDYEEDVDPVDYNCNHSRSRSPPPSSPASRRGGALTQSKQIGTATAGKTQEFSSFGSRNEEPRAAGMDSRYLTPVPVHLRGQDFSPERDAPTKISYERVCKVHKGVRQYPRHRYDTYGTPPIHRKYHSQKIRYESPLVSRHDADVRSTDVSRINADVRSTTVSRINADMRSTGSRDDAIMAKYFAAGIRFQRDASAFHPTASGPRQHKGSGRKHGEHSALLQGNAFRHDGRASPQDDGSTHDGASQHHQNGSIIATAEEVRSISNVSPSVNDRQHLAGGHQHHPQQQALIDFTVEEKVPVGQDAQVEKVPIDD
ncbi:unnamed protein product, partial [Amoebophrya sp. A25]